MADTIYQCDLEIRKLNNALNQISYIRSYLANYISNVDIEISKLVASYSVDGTATNAVTRLRALRNDANETSNYLKNTIVPGINNAIYQLRKKKQSLAEESA